MVRYCCVCKKNSESKTKISFHRFPLESKRRKLWYEILGLSPDKILPKYAEVCSNHFQDNDFQFKCNGIRFLTRLAIPMPYHDEVSELSDHCGSASSPAEDTTELGIKQLLDDEPPIYWVKEENDDIIQVSPGQYRAASVQLQPHLTGQNEQLVEYARTATNPSGFGAEQTYKLMATSSSSTITASETEEGPLELIETEQDVKPIQRSKYRFTAFLSGAPKKRKRRYFGDLPNVHFPSPKKAKRNLKIMNAKVDMQRRKVKMLQKKVNCLETKVETLYELMAELQKRSLRTQTPPLSMQAALTKPASDIWDRLLDGRQDKFYPPLK